MCARDDVIRRPREARVDPKPVDVDVATPRASAWFPHPQDPVPRLMCFRWPPNSPRSRDCVCACSSFVRKRCRAERRRGDQHSQRDHRRNRHSSSLESQGSHSLRNRGRSRPRGLKGVMLILSLDALENSNGPGGYRTPRRFRGSRPEPQTTPRARCRLVAVSAMARSGRGASSSEARSPKRAASRDQRNSVLAPSELCRGCFP